VESGEIHHPPRVRGMQCSPMRSATPPPPVKILTSAHRSGLTDNVAPRYPHCFAGSVWLSGCSVSSPAQAILPYGIYMECLHGVALLFFCRRLTRSSAQDSDVFFLAFLIADSRHVFFLAFLIAVGLRLKVCLLECRYSFSRSAVLRMREGRSVERDNRLRGEISSD